MCFWVQRVNGLVIHWCKHETKCVSECNMSIISYNSVVDICGCYVSMVTSSPSNLHESLLQPQYKENFKQYFINLIGVHTYCRLFTFLHFDCRSVFLFFTIIYWWDEECGHIRQIVKMHYFFNRGPQALTVTWVSETLHWFLVKRAHICISTAPS